MSSKCPWGENSAYTPEVPCRMPRLGPPQSYRCTPIGGPVSNTGKHSSGGFHTHFASSPLFARATLPCRPTHASATTATTCPQCSSYPLLALFNLVNRFLNCTTWRWRTSQSCYL